MPPTRSFCRLAPLATNFVGSYQAGFVGGKSTTDQIFTLRQILQKCRERQIPTHHLFIDFKAAYGTIDQNELWIIMQQYQFPGIRLLEATMGAVQGETIDVEVGIVRISQGLRQVDGLSCPSHLFNIALEGVI